MLIGIEFELPLMDVTTVWDVLKSVNISKYYWYIVKSQTEVWCEKTNTDFFKKKGYFGDEFIIQLKEKSRVNFLKLQVYTKYSRAYPEIHTYKEFLSSECQFIVLIYDNIFVEIYAKEYNLVKTLQKTAQGKHCSNINLITERN